MKSKTKFMLCAIALVFGAVIIQPLDIAAADDKAIILATTTSTQDSGLLDLLVPAFEKQSGLMVKTIAVGSGQAMTMGRKGEADVLLVHSPAAEEKFMAEGFGTTRRIVMHNDFVIVGPAADPAKIKGMKHPAEALKAVGAAGGTFVSRGDNSGTHSKEQALWKAAEVTPEGRSWYQQTGLGMGQTLNVASEKGFYTLADRGTYLAMKKTLALEILVEGEKSLLNVYHVIEVSHAMWPKVNAAGAKAFADFMVADETQKTIAGFGVEKYGSPLFFPDAGTTEK
ncbi:MAG: ABC transporter substrate-binding protein [Candidatus Methylomirabilia bacterium]